jgi:hypothetical protein
MSEHCTEYFVLTYVASQSQAGFGLGRSDLDATQPGAAVVAPWSQWSANWSIAAVARGYAMQQITRARDATKSI